VNAAEVLRLGRYEFVAELGAGAFGRVYEAIDRNTGEHVAIKELHRVGAPALLRFKREFRLMQEVHHPNLVRLDGLFEAQGQWLIAMELVRGDELRTYLYREHERLHFDEAQLRDVFGQLAEGLNALHGAGVVHCDLKPTNVRVTAQGRVVLLDFGLATWLDPRSRTGGARSPGTVAYMAPEQGEDQAFGAAVDWYAFGVCLYEALTGVLPIEAESVRELLEAKRLGPPPLAASLVPDIPEDLNQLCSALLEISPQARCSGRSASKALARRGHVHDPERASGAAASSSAFSGRDEELACLQEAFDRVEGGAQRVVLIEGESGIGKSTLVEHFFAGIKAQRKDALVLYSRCYENALVPYEAFDGAMEELARLLDKLDQAEAEALLPPRAALICRLFPALNSVRVLTQTPVHDASADPGLLRLEAFTTLAQLFAQVSRQRPLVLAIDDLQWADPESFRLLDALLQAGLPLRCLVLATLRSSTEHESEAAESITRLRERNDTTVLSMHGLPRTQALGLARDAMGPRIPDAWLEKIVDESAGHPLFLTLLTRFAESHDPNNLTRLTLDDAIGARIGALSVEARTLLETVAVAGAPLAAPLCGRAANLSDAELARLIAQLCGQKLLRRRRAGEIAPFHDRIRRVMLDDMPQAQARVIHANIALALAANDNADPAALARHYQAAEQPELALRAYKRAAFQANATLAFAQAAELYARALALVGADAAAERSQLGTERGHALACAGHSAEAARQFLEAAQTSVGEAKTRLRIWAAQHLVQSGHVAEGMQAGRELLDELGVPLPTSTPALLARLLWDRACLRLGGLESRADGGGTVQQRMQLDALWGLALPVSWIDPLASAAIGVRHLRLSLAIGDPIHIARGLAEAAFARALEEPDDPQADVLLARARSLATGTSEPALEVTVSYREAAVATFRWDLPRACERYEHALRVLTERCPGQPWLLTIVRTALAANWASTGDHARLAAALSSWQVEARERDDQFAITMFEGIGCGTIKRLMGNTPDAARVAMDAAMAPWPREPFSFAHLGELIGISYIELYRGGAGALAWYDRERARLARSFLLKVGMGQALYLSLHAHAMLAAYVVAPSAERPRLLERTRAMVPLLRRNKTRLAQIAARSLDAQLAALGGDFGAALDSGARAQAQAQLCGDRVVANAFGYFLGFVRGSEAGQHERDEAVAFFREQGWQDPLRACRMLCPAVTALERAGRRA
jgi:hypothetical protein